VYRWVERLLAPRTDAIIAVSDQEAEEGRSVLGPAGRHIRVIPNGVDRTRFSPDGERAGKGDKPLIVCVGRLSRQKGQDVALRALAMLESDEAILRLVGDEYPPGERDRLEALASSVGVAERVEWWGKVSDTAPLLRAADVVIAPSRWEGMSLVFLEAMACGAAIVASDVFGSNAIGAAGVIVTPDDPAELAGAIDRLLQDPSERARLGAAARARSARFDLAETLDKTIGLWAELVGRSHPMPANTAR
jgi:glycosyltransferase involved in cell wall biosynthesis